jgi:hypothetical protein
MRWQVLTLKYFHVPLMSAFVWDSCVHHPTHTSCFPSWLLIVKEELRLPRVGLLAFLLTWLPDVPWYFTQNAPVLPFPHHWLWMGSPLLDPPGWFLAGCGGFGLACSLLPSLFCSSCFKQAPAGFN